MSLERRVEGMTRIWRRIEEVKADYQAAGFHNGSKESNAAVADLLRQYEFLGRIVGKATCETADRLGKRWIFWILASS